MNKDVVPDTLDGTSRNTRRRIHKALDKLEREASHDVVEDRAGAGYERWSCRSCGATCLRAPHMSDAQWKEKVEQWHRAHPRRS